MITSAKYKIWIFVKITNIDWFCAKKYRVTILAGEGDFYMLYAEK